MKVPRYDPTVSDAAVRDRIIQEIQSVADAGAFIGGPWVERLEARLAEDMGRPCVCVASGTDALTLALIAGVTRQRGQVAVPSLSFSATASAVLRAGFTPVFVDVEPATGNIDWRSLMDVVEAVDAVVPVHLYGRVTEPPVQLPCVVIEDACQAYGAARAGQIGKMAAFSFFPSKPLGCWGDGGVVFGDQPAVDRAHLLARHGAQRRYISDIIGFNSRLDAIQATVLLAKVDGVEEARRRRSKIALAYSKAIEEMRREWFSVPPWTMTGSWHIYALRCSSKMRDAILVHLRAAGVDAAWQYPPLHTQPAFARFPCAGSMRSAEKFGAEVVSLPIWAGMTDEQVSIVIDALDAFCG